MPILGGPLGFRQVAPPPAAFSISGLTAVVTEPTILAVVTQPSIFAVVSPEQIVSEVQQP